MADELDDERGAGDVNDATDPDAELDPDAATDSDPESGPGPPGDPVLRGRYRFGCSNRYVIAPTRSTSASASSTFAASA